MAIEYEGDMGTCKLTESYVPSPDRTAEKIYVTECGNWLTPEEAERFLFCPWCADVLAF